VEVICNFEEIKNVKLRIQIGETHRLMERLPLALQNFAFAFLLFHFSLR